MTAASLKKVPFSVEKLLIRDIAGHELRIGFRFG